MARFTPRKARILVGTGIFWLMVLCLSVGVRFRLVEVAARLAVPGAGRTAPGIVEPEDHRSEPLPVRSEAEQKKIWEQWHKTAPVPGPEDSASILENFLPDAGDKLFSSSNTGWK